MASNTHVVVNGELGQKDRLADAIRIAISARNSDDRDKMLWWKVGVDMRVDIFSYVSDPQKTIATPFMSPATPDNLAATIISLYEEATYPQEPGIDGTTIRGWRLERIGSGFGKLFTVKPDWILYGK